MVITFKNQTVLVTGGTRGIGKALALAFLEADADVVITGSGDLLPDWFSEYNSCRISYAPLNLLNKDWHKQLEDIMSKYERIDVCVNNAGINITSFINEIDGEDLSNIINTNLYAPIMISSEVSKKMIRNNYGRITNIASIFGVVTKTMRNAYTASKSGLIGVTKTMAVDLGSYGILVNAVSPGFVDTELTRRVLGAEGMAEMATRIPVKRLAQTGDIVPAVLFLSSKNNTYITGQNLIVDGGFTLE